MKTNEIRKSFLHYFKEKGHKIVASDSLVPQNDPTLLFTGAGMNQFKDYFLGLNKYLKRVASSQKCLRTGDLDEVGRTAYHHSFFEMLGNFSFGDYFKKEAIRWAWDFLTSELGLEKTRLRASVHDSDEEAYRIWRNEIGLPEKQITRLGDKTNFWPSNAKLEGPNGPCGPCSEIYYDQGEDYTGKPHNCSIEHDCGRFAEIWNLVFTQFDRQEGGVLVPLKQKNIDTGMGLERLACVLQKKRTNFEIDIFEPLIRTLEETLRSKQRPESVTRFYAIIDHLRAAAFAIADGVIPANEGRGYVIRKLIRRAVWNAYQIVGEKGLEDPRLYKLAAEIIQMMKDPYPELLSAQKHIEDTLRGEEDRFLRTLASGLLLLQEKIKIARQKARKKLEGEEVFLLYDTYGFPDELTRTIARSEGLEIDQETFNRLMEEQRKRAKGTSPIAQTIFVTSEFDERLHRLVPTEFLGYQAHEAKAKVLLAQFKDDSGIIVLDQTPFYAESGGQVGDQGILKGTDWEARVEDTQKKDRYHLHYIRISKGIPKEGMALSAVVDSERRNRAMRNHTATHLLHAVLREVLGNQVRQLGSLVHPDRLRFDYAFLRPLTKEELETIERRVNEEILKDTAVEKAVKTLEEAKNEGAIAFFGEKYGNDVRVITVPGISKELCGGTHCERTGQIGAFVIVSDSSIASGVRRIEALTGTGALSYLRRLRSQMEQASEKLKTTPEDLLERIQKLQEKVKILEKEADRRPNLSLDSKELLAGAERVKTYQLVAKKFRDTSRQDLRKLSDSLRSQTKCTVWFFAAETEGKTQFLAGLSADLKTGPLDAREIAKHVSPFLGGSGGGRKDLAEGGGTRSEALEKSWPRLVEALKQHLAEKG